MWALHHPAIWVRFAVLFDGSLLKFFGGLVVNACSYDVSNPQPVRHCQPEATYTPLNAVI